MFWILHIIAAIIFFPALVVTIALHLIYNTQREKSDEVSKLSAQLEKSNEMSQLATQLDIQWHANKPKDDDGSDIQNDHTSHKEKIDDKWVTAKKYLNEVKDGLSYIYSEIEGSTSSREEAETALKEIFNQLGVSAITQPVLDNIVKQVRESEAKKTKAKEKLHEERLAHELEQQEILERAAQLEHSYMEPKQLEQLYDAVNSSKYNEVVKLLSPTKTSCKVRIENKIELQSIAKKRGDKKIFRVLDKVKSVTLT
ncbi:MAG: chromosome segregation ATPase [Psychroserpens sp.]|jgi:chromosome segregation ATPase